MAASQTAVGLPHSSQWTSCLSDEFWNFRALQRASGCHRLLCAEYTPDFVFKNLKVLFDTPDQVYAEYEFTAVSSKTGRSVHHPFFGRLVAENGKIKLLRV